MTVAVGPVILLRFALYRTPVLHKFVYRLSSSIFNLFDCATAIAIISSCVTLTFENGIVLIVDSVMAN